MYRLMDLKFNHDEIKQGELFRKGGELIRDAQKSVQRVYLSDSESWSNETLD